MALKTSKAALDGARDILMERFSEDAALMGKLRKHLWDNGELRRQRGGKEQDGCCQVY